MTEDKYKMLKKIVYLLDKAINEYKMFEQFERVKGKLAEQEQIKEKNEDN